MISLVFANTVSAVGAFNIMIFHAFEPIMAALKVLTDAMVQTGDADYAFQAEEIRAEVEETEAIISAYWEGVLEEGRRELREQRREAATLAGEARAGEEEGAVKKSKAAKRKQQKRKAQQQKKAEVAEVAVAAAAARGEAMAVSQEQLGQQAEGRAQQKQKDKEEQEDRQQEEEEDEHEGEGKDDEQAVTVAMVALAAMATSGIKGQKEEEEEEEEDECSVCLNAIESDDAANPADRPMICGHLYHACIFGWRNVRASASSRPALVNCRSPLQEVEST